MVSDNAYIVLLTLGTITALVLMVAKLRINAFIALTLSSLLLGTGVVFRGFSFTPAGGVARPITLLDIIDIFQTGLGKTLGGIGGIICLGAMLGKFLGESGGAEVLAKRFSAFLGPKRIGWLIPLLALSVGLTTWFAVGLLLLLPILLTLTRETKRPFILLALPLLSFLSVMHGVMPPHPGPVIAVNKLQADTGKLLLWGLLLGIPVAAIAGPLFARIAVKRVNVNPPPFEASISAHEKLPSFGLTLASILFPVALLLLGTVAELAHIEAPALRNAMLFIGHPTIALLISVLFALWALGTNCGRTLPQLLKFSDQSIASIGSTLVIIGAGGGFGRVMTECGVARVMGELAAQANLSPIMYGWLISAFIRVSTGSATVAITVAAELLAPVLGASPGTNKELAIVAIGCGSLFLSHLNDSGFWMVKECFGLTIGETLRTWTITETLVGLGGLALTLLAHSIWAHWFL
ncbi:MAG: gluconate:H+ symporter [Verrucomicrobiota bacterium]